MQTLREAIETQIVNQVIITIRNGLGDTVLALPLIRYVASLCGRDRLLIWGRGSFARTVFAEFAHIFVPMSEDWKIASATEARHGIMELCSRIPRHANVGWVSLNSYPMVASEQQAIEMIEPKRTWKYTSIVWRDNPRERSCRRSDQYFRVIGESQINLEIDRRPRLDAQALDLGREFRSTAARSSRKLLAIHAEAWEKKRQWPLRYWQSFFDSLKENVLAVALGLEEQDIYNIRGIKRPECGWLSQAGIVAAADVFIGIDSSWAHIADAFEIPGLVLFVSGSAVDQWGPRSKLLNPLVAPERNLACLKPEMVVKKIATLL